MNLVTAIYGTGFFESCKKGSVATQDVGDNVKKCKFYGSVILTLGKIGIAALVTFIALIVLRVSIRSLEIKHFHIKYGWRFYRLMCTLLRLPLTTISRDDFSFISYGGPKQTFKYITEKITAI